MDNYIKIIKGLAEKNRVRILALLHRIKTEVCVCEIVDALEECQYNVSRHLKVLQQAGLIISRKKGKWNYYRLNEKQVPFQEKLLQAVNYISSDTMLLSWFIPMGHGSMKTLPGGYAAPATSARQ
ncbi:MAG: metalloregulator ArsR/SmtB family transcription factor [Bacillota bacterium]